MKSHSVLIDRLGGAPRVAKALQLKSNVVSNWVYRGIPWRWRLAVVRLAEKQDPPVEVPNDFLDSKAA